MRLLTRFYGILCDDYSTQTGCCLVHKNIVLYTEHEKQLIIYFAIRKDLHKSVFSDSTCCLSHVNGFPL